MVFGNKRKLKVRHLLVLLFADYKGLVVNSKEKSKSSPRAWKTESERCKE